MATENLVITAEMRNEISGPARAAKRDVQELGRAAERTGRQAGGAGSQGLSRMETMSRRLHETAGKLHGRLRTMSSWVGTAFVTGLRRGALALGAITTAVAVFGLKASSNFQQARIAFDTLLGSAQAGGALFKQLQAINLKTPFELGEIAPATQLLLRYGIAADKVVPTLKSILDAAALSGNPSENLQRIALAVGQINQQGRVLGQDARQLAESGINVYAVLAEKMGKTASEVRDLGAQGKLSSDLFMDALVNMEGPLAALQGGSEKMGKTLAGQFSNLKDAINVRLADAAAPLVERLTGLIKPITDLVGQAVDQIGPPIFDLVDLLAQGLIKILPIAAPLLTVIITQLGRLLDAAGPGLESLAPLADEIGTGLVELVDALVPVMPDLVTFFIALIGVLPVFLQLLTALVPLVGPIARLATALLRYDAVRGVLAATLAVLLGYRAVSGLVGGLQSFASALGLIGTKAAVAGGEAQLAQGRFAGLAQAAAGTLAAAGLAATGVQVAGRLKKGSKPTAGQDLGLLATTTTTGAAIGSLVPGVGTLVGGAGGFAVGGGIILGDRLSNALGYGDVAGNLAASSRVHSAASGAGGRTAVTSSVRDFALASPASGHRRGTAWDTRAEFPQAYAGAVRSLGGFATVHGDGAGRHVHSQIGDVNPAPWSTGSDAAGGMLPAVQVLITGNKFYGQIDVEEAVAKGTARGLERVKRRRAERAHKDRVL